MNEGERWQVQDESVEPERDERGGGERPMAVVVGTSSPVARAVRDALSSRDYEVAVIGGPGVVLDTPEAVDAEFATATAGRPVEVVVHVDVPEAAWRPMALVDLDGPAWDRTCEGIIRSTLLVFQAAHRSLSEGGSLVVVIPSIALTGAAGLAAWSAAAEAQRIMAKVAARRWGARGITVNVVSVPPALLCDEPDAALDNVGRTKAAPALGVDASTPAAVADLVCLLTMPDARTLTGSTLVADGGRLMVP